MTAQTLTREIDAGDTSVVATNVTGTTTVAIEGAGIDTIDDTTVVRKAADTEGKPSLQAH